MTSGRSGARIGRFVLLIAAASVLGAASSTFARGSDKGSGGSADSGKRAQTPAKDELAVWRVKWQQLQAAPDSVPIGDHWRVCELKFRFRHYRDLFECLDLMDARTVRLDAKTPEHRYAPVLIGWMRSQAYAEVGEDDKALSSAETAWEHLPQDYRDASSGVSECHSFWQTVGYWICRMARNDEFQEVAIEAGGEVWEERNSYDLYAGLNNPAGLDLRSQSIAMSLDAQRAMLHLHRGEIVPGKEAIAELDKWMHGYGRRFATTAFALSIGPMYGLGDYAGVVKAYGRLKRDRRIEKVALAFNRVITLGLTYVGDHIFSVSDSRRFATALEDVSNDFLNAASLARLGQTARARKAFDAILAAPEVRDMGSIYWAALYERSQIALKDGQRAQALGLLEQAADAIERVRNTITFEAGKIGFAASKQDVYAALVNVLAQSGDWQGAFIAAERAKGRALVDLLAQVHDLPPPQNAGDRVRELLASAQVNETDTTLPDSAEAAATRGIILTSRGELAQTAPETASLLSVQSASAGEIGARLQSGEALVDYFEAGGTLYAFLLNGAEVRGFRLQAPALEDKVRKFRAAIESRDASTAAQARQLYDILLRPLARELNATTLTVSPHGVLHYLPFAALMDGDQYLVDQYSLRITPSATALVYLKSDRPEKLGKLLALGNPDLGNPRFDLPHAQEEAVQVAQMFANSRALVRGDASKAAVRELGSSFSILHFASHGVFDSDRPLNSGLELARGVEADGRLSVADLYSMRLDAQLVTLSACQTGLGRILSGDDVMGLTRGFLHAGARSIVASLWSVDDAATAELMISFYRNLDEYGAREALRLAQLQTRKTHPDPVFWAAFEVMGSAN